MNDQFGLIVLGIDGVGLGLGIIQSGLGGSGLGIGITQSGLGGSGLGNLIGLSIVKIGSIGFMFNLFLHLPIDEALHYIPLLPVSEITVLILLFVY